MLCRRLVGQSADPAVLADPSADLKSLLAG